MKIIFLQGEMFIVLESVEPETKKNPYAKIEKDKNSKRYEILDPGGGKIFLDEQEPEADWIWCRLKQQVTASDVFLQMGLKIPTSASCEDVIITIELPGESRQNIDLKIKQDNSTTTSQTFHLN